MCLSVVFLFNYLCLFQVVENAFGILAARWRIYYRCLDAQVQNVTKIVGATVCLHNFFMTTQRKEYAPQTLIDYEQTADGKNSY